MKRLSRNILSVFSGDIAGRAIGFVITVYLARVLTPAGFGMFAIGLAVLGHLQLIASPGIQLIEMRNVAAGSGAITARMGGVLVVRLMLATILAMLAAIVLPFVVHPRELVYCILLSLLSMFPLALFVDWVLQGKEEFVPISISRVSGYAVYAVAVFLLVRASTDLLAAPVAFFAGNVVTAAILLVSLGARHSLPRLSWTPALWGSIARENAPTGIAVFCGQLVFNLPPLVVGYVLGTYETGLYGAATKLVFLLLMVDRILNAVLLPALTRMMNERADEVPEILTLTLKFLWLLGPPFILGGIFLAPPAVGIIFGDAYSGAGSVAQVLVLYVGLTALNSVAACTVIASRNEKAFVRRMIAGSVVLAVAVIVFTPLFGIVGAAIGATLGEAVTLLMMARKAMQTQPLVKSGLSPRVVLVIILPFALAWWIHALPPLVATGSSVAVWGIVLLATGAVTAHDRARLRALLI